MDIKSESGKMNRYCNLTGNNGWLNRLGRSDPSLFNPMGVTPKPVSACHDFPGPGFVDAHLETHSHHNPMKEYLNADDTHIHHVFDRFVKKHGKNYTKSEDHAARKNVFKHNLR